MRTHQVVRALVLLGVLSLAVPSAQADELYGRITGVVMDPSGAVVPAAEVTVTNTATGVTRSMKSLVSGDYAFANLLAPGIYTVEVVKEGFLKSEKTGIHLNVNQVFVADFSLKLGSSTQAVTVEAPTAQIDTTSMQLGTTITSSAIVDMPLNGRNWIQLQQLEPGVVGISDRLGYGTNGLNGTNFSTNGAERQQNSFYVNGVDTADIALNAAGIIPSPDAIAEFHLVTSTINPEYGRNSGAVMNAVIKSGSNQIHGDGFEFYRDTFLDARNFFQSTTAPYHQNQFGATIGGPVLLPHIYDGKNKTFFFFSYQGIRNSVPQPFSVPTVYTAAQRAGAFPDLATSTGTAAFPLLGDNGTTYPAGTPYSTIFSSGTIPSADLNPLAVKLVNQFVPLPNLNGNEYTFNPSIVGAQDQYITRIDQNFSSQDSIWGYWFWQRNPTTDTLPFVGSSLPGFPDLNGDHSQQYALAWNHTFSGTTLNEARFGYFRFNYVAVYPINPINPTSYGFTGIAPQLPTYASIPFISVTGLFNLGFSEFGPQPRLENTYQAIDNFSKVVRSHTLKAGFTMDRFEMYNPFSDALSGAYSFLGTGPFSTGDAGADFLLGLPSSYNQTNGAVNDVRSREYYSYIQDEWKVRKNVTLTFGTGWDIETPYVNLYYNKENVNAFRPGVQSRVFPTAPTGVLWPGDPGINDAGGVRVPYHDFAPRLGVAWAPGGSDMWSIHAGVGIYYNRTEGEVATQNLFVPPFTITTAGVGNIDGSPSLTAPFTGWCPTPGGAPTACSTPNPFPFTPQFGAGVNFAPFEPMSINTLSPNFGVPMSENYNLTLKRQLSGSMTLSVAYVGNVAHHLEGNYELNPAGVATGNGMNPVAAAIPNCTPANLGTCAPQTFRYNPLTTGLGTIADQVTDFNSNYNSLQVAVNKRFTKGLAFLAAYTWSRYYDYNSTADNQDGFVQPGINPFNLNDMYGPSDNDAPQRFVLSYDYTLPFYHFVHRVRPLTDGWRLVGITTFQTGFPVRIANSNAPSDTCWSGKENIDVICWDRPNTTGTPLAIGNPRTYTIGGLPNYYFNPAAFAVAAPGTSTGTASRNMFHGPGINNFDLTLMKDVHFTESKYVELRFETYNLFNHTQFSPFSYQPTNDIGGVVADIADPRFGEVIAASSPRVIQIAGKIYF